MRAAVGRSGNGVILMKATHVQNAIQDLKYMLANGLPSVAIWNHFSPVSWVWNVYNTAVCTARTYICIYQYCYEEFWNAVNAVLRIHYEVKMQNEVLRQTMPRNSDSCSYKYY